MNIVVRATTWTRRRASSFLLYARREPGAVSFSGLLNLLIPWGEYWSTANLAKEVWFPGIGIAASTMGIVAFIVVSGIAIPYSGRKLRKIVIVSSLVFILCVLFCIFVNYYDPKTTLQYRLGEAIWKGVYLAIWPSMGMLSACIGRLYAKHRKTG